MTTLGVLLAAGAGSRFGGTVHKLLAPLGDRCVLRWSLDALVGAAFDESAIVVGAVDLSAEIPESLQVIENPDWQQGQATSLARAVAFARTRGHDVLVIGLADQPLVPASAWRAVAAPSASPIVTASFSGARRPPVRLDREVWSRLPASGDAGARVLMQDHPELVTVVEVEGDAVDIDDEQDLVRALALVRERS